MKALQERGEDPLFPHNPAGYLTRWLFEIGPTGAGAMGDGPLSYQELRAWQELGGVELLPWEARTLRTLSIEYAVERQKAEELDRPAPYAGEVDDIAARRSRVKKQVRAAFAGLKKKEG